MIWTEEWAGSGHNVAALAIAQALRERSPASNVRIVYGLSAVSPALRHLSDSAYRLSLQRMPGVWQHIYEREKLWKRLVEPPLAVFLGDRLLKKVIEKERPDAVVATHAYCLPALEWAKRRASRPFQLGIVQTDYQVNSFWINRGIDYYIVSHEQIGEQLTRQFAIEPSRVHPAGIPVRPEFARHNGRTKREWREALGLSPDLFTVLLTSGGDGHNDYLPVVKRLFQLPQPLQVAVISGRNRKQQVSLLDRYREQTVDHVLHVTGYVQEMWAWMGAADAVVTKPGGLTCAEVLAMGIPLILYRPLPGQERRNSRFLQSYGAATQADSPEEVAATIARWQTEVSSWTEAAALAARLARPDAVYRAAEVILSSMKSS